MQAVAMSTCRIVGLLALAVLCMGMAAALPKAKVEWSVNLSKVAAGTIFYGNAPVYSDIDKDGVIEIVTSFYEGHRVFVFDGRNGNIEWIFPTLDKSPMPTRGGYSASIADVTRDGKLDIIVSVRASPGHIYCLGNDGKLIWDFQADGHTMFITVPRDIDDDGTLELITGAYRGGQVWVVTNEGKLRWVRNLYGAPIRMANALDVDRDGRNEILVVARDSTTPEGAVVKGAVYCLGVDGSEIWRYDGEPSDPVGCDFAYVYPSCADVNGDGEFEVLVGTREINSLVVLDWLGRQIWRYTDLDEWPTVPMVADIDGDKSLEIVAACASGMAYAFDGAGHVKWSYNFSYVHGGPGYGGALADVTGDGKIDSIIVTMSNGTLIVLDDKGKLAAEPLNLGRQIFGAAVGDLDNDGKSEIALSAGSAMYSLTFDGQWDPKKAPWPMMGRNEAHEAIVPLHEGMALAFALAGLACVTRALRGRRR